MTHQLDKLDVLIEFGIGDSDQSHQYNFVTSNLASDINITLPALTTDDTFVFANNVQTLVNKTIIGGTVSGADLTLESTSNATKGDIVALDNIDARKYIQFTDITAPTNGSNGTGRLYKKTGDDGLFWLPDSGGVELDLTLASGVTDHGDLTGLGDDDHTQYALLAGRSGGQTIIGSTLASEALTLESTSNATKGNIVALDNIDARKYIQFTDIAAPSNGSNGTGRLYKKTGNDGLFWLPDSGGAEIDVTTSGGVTDHGLLSGLGDDDHTQYVLLAGRSGGQTIIGSTLASEALTLESTSNATKGDIVALDNIDARKYIQFTDIAAPSNGSNGSGRLYKKTGNDGLFWLPDSGGAEVDISAAVPLPYQTASQNTQITTTSSSYVLMPGMNITVSFSGVYMCMFSGTGKGSSQNGTYYYNINKNGTPITHSERQITYGNSRADNSFASIHTHAIETFSAGDLCEVDWYRSNTGTYTVLYRYLILIRISG